MSKRKRIKNVEVYEISVVDCPKTKREQRFVECSYCEYYMQGRWHKGKYVVLCKYPE